MHAPRDDAPTRADVLAANASVGLSVVFQVLPTEADLLLVAHQQFGVPGGLILHVGICLLIGAPLAWRRLRGASWASLFALKRTWVVATIGAIYTAVLLVGCISWWVSLSSVSPGHVHRRASGVVPRG
ncbi:MAG: hypothetical protein KF774_07125 [Planctomyces sp.]|nr:hypothetical protein [Planctomyces sp.]